MQRDSSPEDSGIAHTGREKAQPWRPDERAVTVLRMQPTPFTADPTLHEFLIDCRDLGQSPETLRLRRHVLVSVVRATSRYLLDQTPETLHAWYRSYSGHSPATRRVYATAVRAFFAWAIRRKLTATDPTSALPVPKVPAGRPRPISVEDARDAVRAADPRMRCWLLLALGGGLRAAEVARMRREELDGVRLVVIGKGAKEREVTLPPLVAAEVGAWRRRPGRMWAVTAHTLSTTVSRFFDDQDMPWRLHSCRHGHATWLYEQSGGDLLLTAKQLGHENTRTTAGYAKSSTPKLIESVASLDGMLLGRDAA